MPTNDERREVAERLREIDSSKWCCYGHEFDERMIAELMTACGCNYGQDWQDIQLENRIADLIEPESTCMNVTEAWLEFGKNVFNDDALDDFDKFEKVYQILQKIVEPIEITCEITAFDDGLDEAYDGSLHSYAPPTYYLSCGHMAYECKPYYCPSCGAKVMSDDGTC